ncbi:MAG: hypothetical protein QOE70_5471 [Chthoniobacter sp.]|jgi:hypothetical protein|nr:hypothetical protein [Chthoniobacter sp.]
MTAAITNDSTTFVPEIVHIVLSELGKRRHSETISEEEFSEKLARIAREELQPRRLSLLVRHLADGRVRFIIKAVGSGKVCDMVESTPLSSAA